MIDFLRSNILNKISPKDLPKDCFVVTQPSENNPMIRVIRVRQYKIPMILNYFLHQKMAKSGYFS